MSRAAVPDNGPRCFEPLRESCLLRNAAVQEVRRSERELVLSVPQSRPRGLLAVAALIARPAAAKQYALDRVGREIYELCDGRSSHEIIHSLAERHGLTFHEARVALAEFGSTLIQRGILLVKK